MHEIPGGPRVNLESYSEHVTKIETQIQVAKESIRYIIQSLPFYKVPKLFLINLVFKAIKMMNHFPVKGVISDTIIPTTIMAGESFHHKKNTSLHIGKCCHVHEEDTTRNRNKSRTKDAICMGPGRNIQGRFKFMRLRSTEKILVDLGIWSQCLIQLLTG